MVLFAIKHTIFVDICRFLLPIANLTLIIMFIVNTTIDPL